ncbi:MAG: CsgG/HfaB family protein [Planctomycetota bacterium]|jgi:hypothetical protein
MHFREKAGILISAAFVALTVGCTTGESYTAADFDFGTMSRIAIVEVESVIRSEVAENQISDFFVMELLKKGYTPIERQQVQAILAEQKFQAGDLTTSEGAAQAGRILNVPAVMVVNIPEWGENISMTAKIINVEDASIVWIGSGKGGSKRGLGTLLGAAIGAGAGAAVGGSGNEGTGAVIGGVVGGAAGYMLSPEESEAAQKIIRKVTESLPPRTAPN